MIRLTLVLIAGIAVTMYLYGDTSNLPQGSDAGGSDRVARQDADGPGLLTRMGEMIETAAEPEQEAERVPLADERRAIEIALAATVTPDEPAAASPRTVQIGGSDEAAPDATASAEASGDLWIVTGSVVNLRAGPSTSDAVVGQVREGQRAEVIEETADGWFRIRTEDDGQNGYIFGQFLRALNAG